MNATRLERQYELALHGKEDTFSFVQGLNAYLTDVMKSKRVDKIFSDQVVLNPSGYLSQNNPFKLLKEFKWACDLMNQPFSRIDMLSTAKENGLSGGRIIWIIGGLKLLNGSVSTRDSNEAREYLKEELLRNAVTLVHSHLLSECGTSKKEGLSEVTKIIQRSASNEKPFTVIDKKDGKGYFVLNKEKIDFGKSKNKKFRILEALCSPSFGISKNVNTVIDFVLENKPKDVDFDNPYLSKSKGETFLKQLIKEGQRTLKNYSKTTNIKLPSLSIKFEGDKTWLKLKQR